MSTALAIVSLVFRFFGTTLGRYVGYGLIALSVYAAGEIRGRRVEHGKCVAAAEKAKSEAQKRDAEANEAQRKDDADTITQLSTQKDQANARIAKLEEDLRKKPARRCIYGRDGKPADGLLDNGQRPNRTQSPGAPLVLTPRPRPAID